MIFQMSSPAEYVLERRHFSFELLAALSDAPEQVFVDCNGTLDHESEKRRYVSADIERRMAGSNGCLPHQFPDAGSFRCLRGAGTMSNIHRRSASSVALVFASRARGCPISEIPAAERAAFEAALSVSNAVHAAKLISASSHSAQ